MIHIFARKIQHEMDSETYEDWFTKKLLSNVPPKSVVVLDNASIHMWNVKIFVFIYYGDNFCLPKLTKQWCPTYIM